MDAMICYLQSEGDIFGFMETPSVFKNKIYQWDLPVQLCIVLPKASAPWQGCSNYIFQAMANIWVIKSIKICATSMMEKKRDDVGVEGGGMNGTPEQVKWLWWFSLIGWQSLPSKHLPWTRVKLWLHERHCFAWMIFPVLLLHNSMTTILQLDSQKLAAPNKEHKNSNDL